MAGAGYKLFNTGDVLTAAQVNTYLQEQVVMVFASATARTTALSGVLAEGMVSYLKDTDAVEKYNGSSWVAVGGTASPLTTKGDLYTYTTTDARLASSNTNGDVLTVDTSTASGLKWAAPSASGLTYSTWTPTLTGITQGNGTVTARYAQSGKFVTGSFNFTLGSTSAITSGGVSFTLPVTAKNTFNVITDVVFLRSGVGYEYGMSLLTSTTVCYVGTFSTSGSYPAYVDLTSTIPHTWTNTDFISCNFSYEAA